MTKICHMAFTILIAGNLALAQQVLVLNSGDRMEGRYDGGNANSIWFIDEHGNRHKFDIGEIQSLNFNPARTGSGVSDRFAPGAAPPQGSADRGYNDPDAAPDTGWRQQAVIPAGTEIAVRTMDTIDAREAEPNRHYLASIESDVRDENGNVAIPRGAPAHLIVRNVGNGEIAVDLRSVRANGHRYILSTNSLANQSTRAGLGANKRTGEYVGGGALLGTVLGAIVGGGKGAAIGALAGGAGGAGAQVLTRGQELHIPSETILRFRIERPVYMYE